MTRKTKFRSISEKIIALILRKTFLGFVVRLFCGKVKVFLLDEENEEANRNDFKSQ